MHLTQGRAAFRRTRVVHLVPTVDSVSPPFLRRRAEEPPAPAERPDVRKYRYLLRTSPPRRLRVMHRRALDLLDPGVRAAILLTTRERLQAGSDLTVDDVDELAVLVTEAELRTPGILLAGLSDPVLSRLAHVMVVTTEAPDVWEAYAAWDGVDPEPPRPSATPPTPSVLQEA